MINALLCLKKVTSAGVPFCLVSIASNSNVTIKSLSDWDACKREGHKVSIPLDHV